jgi:hypothetical protein
MAAAPMPPVPTPITPAIPPLSQGARIVDTFIAPSKTFTDLRRSASWWAPWLLMAIVGLFFVYAMDRQVGFEQISRNEIARNPKTAEQFDKLTPEQRAKNLQISSNVARYISYGVPALQLISFLVITGVLMGTFNLAAGAGVPFKIAFATVLYGSLPTVIGGLLGTVSLFAGVDPAGFNARNPVATNPAYFMDPAGNKFLYAMASALDVFVIWSIVLIGIGFACNSKVKRGTAIALVAGWYLVYKMIGAAF